MTKFIYRTFLAHPASVDESYFQHFVFAIRFSTALFIAAFAALVHAIVPAACERTASNQISKLHKRMHNR